MVRTSRFMKQLCAFFGTNSRLFLFLALTLSGVVIGCLFTPHIPAKYSPMIPLLFPPDAGFTRVSVALLAFLRQSLITLAALGILMLSGMSLCGLPAALAVPVLYGTVVGIFEASVLSQQGIEALALSLPGTLLSVWAMLIACAEALRLTLRLIAQVMPGSSKGGLWRDFRLFFWRFLLCFALALLASAITTTLAVVF